MNEQAPQQSSDTYRKQLEDAMLPENYLGAGSEKAVYRHPKQPDRVIGIFGEGKHNQEQEGYEKEERFTKARFYITKLVHLLYPNIFPDIHLTTNSPASVEMDYVSIDGPATDEGEELARQLYNEIGLITDPAEGNYVIDSSHNIIYVDTIRPWNADGKLKIDLAKVRKAIDLLIDQERDQALRYLERLQQLHSKN